MKADVMGGREEEEAQITSSICQIRNDFPETTSDAERLGKFNQVIFGPGLSEARAFE